MTTIKTARRLANLKRGRGDWYRIVENVALRDELGGGTGAEVWIYDEIGYFGVTAADFVRDLQAITDKTIVVHLNSPGGDVFDALAIYNGLRNHPATVTMRIEGVAASAASFIAMAGDTVIAEKASEMMIHDARAMAIGLTAAELRDLAGLLDKNSDIIAQIYTDRAGSDVTSWRAAMAEETWYNSDEMLAAGLVDSIAGSETASAADVAASWDLSVFAHAGRKDSPAPPVPQIPAVADEPVFMFSPELFRQAVEEAAS